MKNSRLKDSIVAAVTFIVIIVLAEYLLILGPMYDLVSVDSSPTSGHIDQLQSRARIFNALLIPVSILLILCFKYYLKRKHGK